MATFLPRAASVLAAGTAIASMACLFAQQAAAVDIDFDNPAEYSTSGGEDGMGVLARQGNTVDPMDPCELALGEVGCWRNEFNPDGFRVTAGVGTDGSNGLRTSGDDAFNYVYATDDALLDFEGGATFDNTSSVLYYRFQFQLNNITTTGDTDGFRFGVGGTSTADPVMRILIQDKNALGIEHGDGNTFTVDHATSPGDPMLGPSDWQTISGEINYATQTFTVIANGIQWTFQSPGESGNYNFKNTDANALNGANLHLIAANANDGVPPFLPPQDADYVLDNLRLTSVAPLLGDYNGNGVVGIEDYQLWKDNFGNPLGRIADGNGDGEVNAADYTIWRDAYTAAQAGPGALVSTPEPGSIVLLLASVCSLVTLRRRVA